ncbi:hypothetical protein [Streptomyces sp. AC627_RSS907]|uniref:hypothetical protein n=1 Tax=Streptomyces sp. AC627_RSS907 TaxID=2823684 RepID=UPI001C23C1EF|nr:hypothetical protein [Streptomyces sp. AC627_RSS907]
MKRTKRITSLLAGVVVAFGVGLVPAHAAAEQSADTCLGDWAFDYQSAPARDSSSNAFWPPSGYTRVAYGSPCNDINIKTNHDRTVIVCGRTWCGEPVRAERGKWTVIHHNTTEGAEYYIQFRGVNASTGWIAD